MDKKSQLLVGLLLAFAVNMVRADEVIMFTDQVPTPDELAGALFPDKAEGEPVKIKTRSLQFGRKARLSETTGVGMPIRFDLNSADIKPESKPYLDQIGMMMQMEKLANEKLLIEGYTDALGPEQYNAVLSRKRAQAVKNYLLGKFNISPERIIVSGKGESAALPGTKPTDPMNRRVQFYRGN